MNLLIKSRLALLLLPVLLSSCEFNCRVGNGTDGKPTTTRKNGATIYNGIDIQATTLKLKKAWLMFEDGERVPADNLIDFKMPVQLILEIEEGWQVVEGKVYPGAAEKIFDEDDNELLDEKDLFENTDPVSPEDAKLISLTASIKLKSTARPTSFDVHFRVWDKKGDGEITGKYTLYSK